MISFSVYLPCSYHRHSRHHLRLHCHHSPCCPPSLTLLILLFSPSFFPPPPTLLLICLFVLILPIYVNSPLIKNGYAISNRNSKTTTYDFLIFCCSSPGRKFSSGTVHATISFMIVYGITVDKQLRLSHNICQLSLTRNEKKVD